MKKEKLLLFDTNSIIHRAFHALPPLKSKNGEPGGAIYGSLLAFFKIVHDIGPRYVVTIFDSPGETFRHQKYKEYKANRPKAPDELITQIKKTRDVFSKMGVVTLAKEGLEADDIIGSVSSLAPKDVETVIATGDMDMLQLVNEKIKVYTLKRGVKESILYDRAKVKEKYDGVGPEKIADIKALQGDASDNIPGVEGIGEKTAIKLIKEFNSLENLYTALEKEDFSLSDKIKNKLIEEKKKAFLSKELALINKSDFSDFCFSDFCFEMNEEKIKKTLEDLGFASMLQRFLKKKEDCKENLKLRFK